MAAASRNRAGRLAARAALMLGGILLALLVLELASRALFPDWAPTRADRNFWAHDARLGWKHRPGEQSRMVHVDFDIEVQINSLGLRDTEIAAAGAGERKRVLVLGDSFGWGFGVEHDEIFCERIEARRGDSEFVNASVSGYGTDQQALWFEEVGRSLEPDVVLLLFYENDFENNARAFQYYHYKPRFDVDADGELQLTGVPVPEPTAWQRLHAGILGRTWLLARLYVALGAGRLAEDVEDSQRAVSEKRLERSGAVTRLLFERIASQAQEQGARFVVVSVPMPAAYVDAVRGMLEPLNVPYLPLDSAFELASKALTFEHDGHWNPEGHAVAAEAVEAFLVGLGWL